LLLTAERRAAAPPLLLLLLSAGLQQSIDIPCAPGAQQQTRTCAIRVRFTRKAVYAYSQSVNRSVC